jgi:hypothetical protein
MVHSLGGQVISCKHREFGKADIQLTSNMNKVCSDLFKNVTDLKVFLLF